MKFTNFSPFWRRIFSVYLISLLFGFSEVLAGGHSNEQEINSDTSTTHHQTTQNADQSAELTIWRVEDSIPYLIPKEDYGIFYTEDCYFIWEGGAETKPPGGDDKPLRKTFEWLGKNTSKQKAVAAGLVVNKLVLKFPDTLDKPTYVVEDTESEDFKRYFSKYEIRSKKLPISVPLTEAQAQATLYQVKGNENPYITVVRAEVQSLNAGDSFVLDLGSSSNNVFVYYGAESNVKENDMSWHLSSELLKHEHKNEGNQIRIKNLDDQTADTKLFLEGLGCSTPITSEKIAPANAVETDKQFERERKEALQLQEIIFDVKVGKTRTKKIEEKPLKKEQLKSESCVLLDSKSLAGVFVWKGKNCPEKELAEAERLGEKLLKQSYTWLTKVKLEKENEESTVFKANFLNWIWKVDIPSSSTNLNTSENLPAPSSLTILDTSESLLVPRHGKPKPLPLEETDESHSSSAS